MRLGTPGPWSSVENRDWSWRQRRFSKLVVRRAPRPHLGSYGKFKQSVRTEQSPVPAPCGGTQDVTALKVGRFHLCPGGYMTQKPHCETLNCSACARSTCPVHMESVLLHLLRKHFSRGTGACYTRAQTGSISTLDLY